MKFAKVDKKKVKGEASKTVWYFHYANYLAINNIIGILGGGQ